MTIHTVVIGARGYTGSELLPLLLAHPHCEIDAVGSVGGAGQAVGNHIESMADSDLKFTAIRPQDLPAHPADLYFLALPNGHAEAYVEVIEALCPAAVVIDLSADYRFDDRWVYGQPERFSARIAGAKRIANPGCYATGIQLALAPIIDILATTPVAFGVSGYSGAGKTPSRKNDRAILQDNLLPYALTDHVHEREATRHLQQEIRFLPHVAPFFRGISLTLAVECSEKLQLDSLLSRYRNFYRQCELVTVQSEIPEVAVVRGSHHIIIGGFTVGEADSRRLSLVCVLDNLLKGAATQAVQNMNLAFNLPLLSGLGTKLAEVRDGRNYE